MTDLLELARPEILALQPYQHAAWQPTLERLHANEMPWRASGDLSGAGLNRYPEPQPAELIAHLAGLYGVAPANLLAARGSDEGIDLLVRTFCRAGQDSVLICPPTFGMYEVSARIQGADVLAVALRGERGFQLDVPAVLETWRAGVKLVFLCTPNNPTGNLLERADIEKLCEALHGKAIVVVDEAYLEFAREPSCAHLIERFPNLVVLRTLSKAYALAGTRCGAVIADARIIALLRRVLTPYALTTQTIEAVLRYTNPQHQAEAAERIALVLAQRERLAAELARSPLVRQVWPSAANFLLLDCLDPQRVLQAAASAGLIIRDLRRQAGLEQSLRITVGTPEQNERLLAAIARAASSGEPASASAACAPAQQSDPAGAVASMGKASAPPLAAPRTASVERRTKETDIKVTVDLDREGQIHVATGLGFFDHMLEQIARHGGFSLRLSCRGDLHIDEHHTIEDCALALGQAMRSALGDKRGIHRYGFLLPMDEALAQVAIDLSGRPYSVFEGRFGRDQIGQLPTELVPHFFRSFAESLGAAINIQVRGENTHHMIEACFKGLGRALRQAIRITDAELPSTKGVL